MVQTEIKMHVTCIIRNNENKNNMHQNPHDIAKSIFRGKVIALSWKSENKCKAFNPKVQIKNSKIKTEEIDQRSSSKIPHENLLGKSGENYSKMIVQFTVSEKSEAT